jgi:23S rRNA pseudouridine2604 synthase
MESDTPKTISLNKFISQTGMCSRRQADKLIDEGRVLLNGEIARTGNRVAAGDEVKVDGKIIRQKDKPELIYIALHKPPGIICTTDRSIKNNIVDFVGHPRRIFPIGRLDKPSEGFILLTNDGDIVNKILRAAHAHEKEYIVHVDKKITSSFVKKMASGVPILDTVTLPCFVEKRQPHTFRIVLTQGLNRQIRRMCEYLGYQVTGLKRVRIMNIFLGDLKKGKWRPLTDGEITELKRQLRDS